ncbi:MAG: ankyrin repeat domain-containing protein [Bacteroidales bacterium]|jgi:ankyrin repeat protein|nr:ankyrin repeat domain-containing protein [Bacteroidales bacterium]
MSKVFYDIKSAYSSHKSVEEIHELYRQVEDKDIRDENNGKRSLLHLAASFGDAGAIDILLEGGAKSAVTNDYGDNPLHALAELSECRYNKAPDEQLYHAAKSLYEAKVSVLRKDDSGQTVIM